MVSTVIVPCFGVMVLEYCNWHSIEPKDNDTERRMSLKLSACLGVNIIMKIQLGAWAGGQHILDIGRIEWSSRKQYDPLIGFIAPPVRHMTEEAGPL